MCGAKNTIIYKVLECSEKDQNYKLQFPQPDYWPHYTVLISSCAIGKTWGTNKQVNKQTNKNWTFQFPQPDYQPCHSLDFRTVFGIMIGPFSLAKRGVQTNK